MRVLHLDDEPEFLDIAKSFLEGGGGIEVDVETDAARALDRLSNRSYDAIVSDYLMPGMDGIAFLQEVRKRWGRIPFVLFTGKGREQLAMEALNLGADFYLKKGGNATVQFGELRNVLFQLAQRRNAEKRLVESEREYRDLVENARNVIVKVDAQGKVVYLNPYGMKFFGCNEGVIGLPALGVLLKPNLYSTEEIDRLATMFSPTAEFPSVFTFPIRREEGKASWLAATTRQVRDDSGVTTETLFIGTDVTEAIEAKQMLEDLELTHAAMLNGIGEGIIATNQSGNVIYVNRRAEEVLGATNGGVAGRHVLELLAERDRSAARENLRKRSQGVPGRLEYWLRKEDGSEFLAQVIASPLMQNGQFRGTIYAISDITERKAMEESLRLSEERFRQVAENAEEWIWEVDRDGLYTFSSPAVERILGYSPEELVGKMHFFDLFPPYAREDFKRGAFAVFDSKETFKNFRNPNVRKHGGIVTLETSGTPILGLDGELLGYRGADTDVTDAQEAERVIRESENRLRRAEEVSQSGYFQVNLGTGLVTGSAGAMGVYGVDSRSFPLSEVELMTLPEYRPMLDMAFDAMVERGEPYNVRYKIRRPKDGRIVDIHSVAEYDPKTRTVFGIAHDFSEQARIVEELRESRMKLENAMEIAKLAQWELDPSTGVFLFNDRFYAILGTTKAREGGAQMNADEYAKRFLPPEEAGLVASTIEEGGRALVEGRLDFARRIEHDIIRRDGERRTVSVILRAARDDPTKATKVHGLIQDITERKRTEASLRRANTRLELLNSIARHDIGNQVTVLSGNLKLLKMTNADPKTERRIERMEGATEDIRGRLQLVGSQISGAEGPVWQNVEELIESLPVLKDVEKLEMGDGIRGLEILADPMFRIVIHNLLEDSVKYGNDPTTVRFSAFEKGGDLHLVYEDEGAGIASGSKEDIFQRHAGHDTGIGLPLCREILSESDITIRETGTPGTGVRFELLVPAGHYRVS